MAKKVAMTMVRTRKAENRMKEPRRLRSLGFLAAVGGGVGLVGGEDGGGGGSFSLCCYKNI